MINRKRKSQEKLEQVFIALLQTQELHTISVSALCKKAGLNRSTFYANYLDVYDLADKVRDRLEEAVSKLYEKETAEKYNSNDFLRLFRHIHENQDIYRAYFKLGHNNKRDFTQYQYDTDMAETQLGSQFLEYHLTFFDSGFNAIVKLWLEKGCREAPEDMARILQDEYRGRQEFFSQQKEQR